MPLYAFTLNGSAASVDVDPAMPLLWVLRDTLGLTGTKCGCGVGDCGACTVLLDGSPVRSCLVSIATAAGRSITTIEGLSPDGTHPLQIAWAEGNVGQCGFCQPAQLLAAAALLASDPSPSPAAIEAAMDPILCRCGTYQRIRLAIADVAGGP